MVANPTTNFLAGVIEGFYGPPWSPAERWELFDWMSRWGLNTYLYAPKDDLKHRTLWREPYSASESEVLARLIQACQQHQLHFIYALSPGLDLRYSQETDLELLRLRLAQMQAWGCQHFALLFDDIPDRLGDEDLRRWGSLAAAQCHVANLLFRWTRERHASARFLFCPTPYCGRMAGRQLGGPGYLDTIGRELLPEIDVLWTGPEIVSREIPVAHIQELRRILRRKPVIWDNLHANDYDGRRFYCGPYSGRPVGLRDEVNGLLSNPNTEFPLNYVPLRTLAEFVEGQGPWEPRQAYLSAMREWRKHFATVTQPVSLEDLIQFGDCYYLPYEEGPEAEALYGCVRDLLTRPPEEWGERVATFQRQAARLKSFCTRVSELRHRPLFYALSRRIWELREELDLLDRYMQLKSTPGNAEGPCHSDYHLPGTYRGGLVARLQRLLVLYPDGSLHPQPPLEPHAA